MPVLDHDILDIVRVILRAECDQILFFHDMLDRNALIDQRGHRIGIQRAGDQYTAAFLGHMPHIRAHLCAEAEDHAAHPHLDHEFLVFFPVRHDHKIPGFHMILHDLVMGRSHVDLPFPETGLVIPDHDLAFDRLRYAAVLRIRF